MESFIFCAVKDLVPQILTLGEVYKFQCELYNESFYGEFVKHLDARTGEYIGISPSTNEKAQPKRDSARCHHLLKGKYSLSFEEFNVLY